MANYNKNTYKCIIYRKWNEKWKINLCVWRMKNPPDLLWLISMLNRKVSKQKKQQPSLVVRALTLAGIKCRTNCFKHNQENQQKPGFPFKLSRLTLNLPQKSNDSATDESRTEEGTQSVMVHFILLTFLMFDVSGHEPNKHNQTWVKLGELAGNGAPYKGL